MRIQRRLAIINMQNEDDQCFKWSVTRALNSKEIPTVKALKQLAKERGLKGYLELNKSSSSSIYLPQIKTFIIITEYI